MTDTSKGFTHFKGVDAERLAIAGTEVVLDQAAVALLVGAAASAHIPAANAAHSINATFSNTEVKAALDALGAKLNAVIVALETFKVTASS